MSEQVNRQSENDPENHIDAGISKVEWRTWEYPPHERSALWFIFAALIGIALLIYAVTTQNYLFGVIVLMMGVILLIDGLRHPERVDVHITDQGVVMGTHFYPYEDIKDFSLIYRPPETKLLYIDFNNLWQPLLTIPLEDVDPNAVRDNLLPYVYENLKREEESLTDTVKRLYKL